MDISRQSQARIEDLQAMPSAAQFEKIAMNIKNPQIYQQFMAAEEDAEIADYAYAAGLISKADADFIKNYEENSESGIPAPNPATPAPGHTTIKIKHGL